jgi:hypothetical protein
LTAAFVLLVAVVVAMKAGVLPGSMGVAAGAVTVNDIEAIRTETDRLEREMLQAWQANQNAREARVRLMTPEEQKRSYPGFSPDLWHHKEEIESLVWSVRSDCTSARDAVLYGDSASACRVLDSMREKLRRGWLHQELWKAGRAN